MFGKYALLLMLLTLWTLPSVAADAASASPAANLTREALRSAWEEAQRLNPDVKLFEKTNDPDVYNVELSLFPYKGRLKILNILIDKIAYDDDAPNNKDVSYLGLVEAELPDAPADLASKIPYSFRAWQRTGRFYYDNTTNEWFAANDWTAHFAAKKPVADKGTCAAPQRNASRDKIEEILISFTPAIGFVAFFFLWARHANRKAVARQKDVQAQFMKQGEEGLALQREQRQLLQDILRKFEQS